ncbi:MAG: hypothetical protein K8S00_12625 [Bacteroidales bacterium]|nr:hypothetical protein [Bacteroidales bacterium]
MKTINTEASYPESRDPQLVSGGLKVQNALWAGDGVLISYLYGRRMKVRKYSSPNSFIEIG